MRIKYYLIIILSLYVTTLLGSCTKAKEESDFVVTIAPIKHIVEQITCGDFSVSVLVPQGASPETFEPTPKQIADLNDAELVFSTGLIEFERSLLEQADKGNNIVNLSQDIELIEGHCSHAHHHGHHHSIDPHIWTSPRRVKQMAHNAYNAIMELYPDSVKYTVAYKDLCRRLDSLDAQCERMISQSNTEAFVIYHPALTYYAQDYNIEQIAIEHEGKEPSAKHIATIIDRSRNLGVKNILYQSEFPKSVVEVIANDIGVHAVEITPLEEDVEKNILAITEAITGVKTK